MDSGGFYAFWIWTCVIAGAGFFVGELNQQNYTGSVCKTHNEVILRDTVYQCKPVALVNQGMRADLK